MKFKGTCIGIGTGSTEKTVRLTIQLDSGALFQVETEEVCGIHQQFDIVMESCKREDGQSVLYSKETI